ncbi:MAG: phospholipid carrier-dependent glycosyltransferase [Alphaproteobacteria bacterium]
MVRSLFAIETFWSNPSRCFFKDVAVLCLLFGTLFTFLLGHRPLATPDEGRYVEIPREMVVTGDYLTPHLNGLKYFEKPPLFYWMQSLSVSGIGLNPFGLRLWTAVLGLLGVIGTYAVGRFALGRVAGLWSAIVLGTSLLYAVLARLIVLDLPLTLFLSASLVAFWLSTQLHGNKRLLCLASWGAGMALASLTKGLIGVAIPGAVALFWIGVTRQGRFLKHAFHPLALFVFFLIAAPWHVLVALKNPEFFDFYFIHEHVLRYTSKIHNRYQPVWFFIPVLMLGFYPWIFYLGQRFVLKPWRLSQKKASSFLTFCTCWASFIFVFFSLSSSKLIPYLLPIFPALAWGVGAFLGSVLENPTRYFRAFRRGTLGWLIFSIFLAFGALAYIPIDTQYFGRKVESLELWVSMGLLAAVLLGGALSVWIALRQGFVSSVLKRILVTTLLFLGVLMYADPYLQPRVSIQTPAFYIKNLLKPGDVVASYRAYYQDLPVYLERTVTVVGFQGELAFGASQEPWKKQLLDQSAFQELWKGENRVFLVMNPMHLKTLSLETPFFILWQDGDYAIISNQPTSPQEAP